MNQKKLQLIADLGFQRRVLDMVEATTTACADICMERVLQDNQWGGPATDDQRADAEWAEYIHKQLSSLFHDTSKDSARDRYVKVAALAVAAIQSIDRKTPQECECPGCSLEHQLKEIFGEDVHVVHVTSASDFDAVREALLSGRKPPTGTGRG